MNITDLIEAPSVVRPCVASPGTDPSRPGELPAPHRLHVPAGELWPHDVVVVRGVEHTVVGVWEVLDGTVRVQLSNGTTHTDAPDTLWEVRRG